MAVAEAPAPARCRTCGAPVYWLKHDRTGNLNPIDVEPSERGNVLIDVEHDRYTIVSSSAVRVMAIAPETLHLSHWVTCSQPPERKHG